MSLLAYRKSFACLNNSVLGQCDIFAGPANLICGQSLQLIRIIQKFAHIIQATVQILNAFLQRSIAAARTRFRIFRQNVDFLLHRAQFRFELSIVDDRRLGCNLSEDMIQVTQLSAMIICRVLHQIVAVWAIQTSLMAVVFVLFAAIAASALNIVITRALAVLIALESFGAACIAVTWLAAIVRESILVRCALVTT